MRDWLRTGRRSAAVGCIALLSVLGAREGLAQYQVFAWDSFESGTVPPTLQMKFSAGPENVAVVAYASPDMPPGILDGAAKEQCGLYGIRFQPDWNAGKQFTAVLNPLTLNRQLLGTTGRALYQADFYLPAAIEQGENLAVLAVAKEESQTDTTSIWRNYRLGILNGNKIYYSYADGSKKKGSPVDYKQDDLASLQVTRPGWHRLQIIFEGQDKILCCVDGKPTSFSPVLEPSLVHLQGGVMVTVPEKQTRTYYADNLSIQWTPEDVPLPDSPWVTGAPGAVVAVAGPAGPSPSPMAAAPAATGMPAPTTGSPAVWQATADQAWEQAKIDKKPVLVLFYAPRAAAYQILDQALQANPSAQQVLAQYVPVKVDVNQLAGGSLAQKFGIFRVPTFLVIGLDTQDKGRITFDRNSQWPTVEAELLRIRAAAK